MELKKFYKEDLKPFVGQMVAFDLEECTITIRTDLRNIDGYVLAQMLEVSPAKEPEKLKYTECKPNGSQDWRE